MSSEPAVPARCAVAPCGAPAGAPAARLRQAGAARCRRCARCRRRRRTSRSPSRGAQIVLSLHLSRRRLPRARRCPGISAVEVWRRSSPRPRTARQPHGPAGVRGRGQARAQAGGRGPDHRHVGRPDRPLAALPRRATAAAAIDPHRCARGTAAPRRPSEAHYFAVRTFGKDGDRSDLSNVASVVPKAPPAAPERVTVTARADGVLGRVDRRAAAAGGYNVYRRDAQERFHGAADPHRRRPRRRSWLDNTARFGQSYIYTVTALAQREPAVESADRQRARGALPGPLRAAVPGRAGGPGRDRPGAAGLAARVDAEDLAGYIVYRRAGNGATSSASSPQPLAAPEYNDTAVAAGQTYSYRVTADRQDRQRERSRRPRCGPPVP